MSKEPKIVWNIDEKIISDRKKKKNYYKKKIGYLKKLFVRNGY